MTKLKAHELRTQKPAELLSKLETLRQELAKLRVAQVNRQASATKLAQIKVVRKNIARVLTVQTQKIRESFRKKLFKNNSSPKFMPKELRHKKTKAMRLALKPFERKAKTLKQKKQAFYFPRRLKIAIKA